MVVEEQQHSPQISTHFSSLEEGNTFLGNYET